jgi:hypothetical protein
MKVNITTTEKEVKTGGMLSRETETHYHLICSISLSPEEARLYPVSGQPHTQLTDEYFERENTYRNFILTDKAVESEDDCYFLSLGQLREAEMTLKSRCHDIYLLLQKLSGFEVEKSYTFDPAEPIET